MSMFDTFKAMSNRKTTLESMASKKKKKEKKMEAFKSEDKNTTKTPIKQAKMFDKKKAKADLEKETAGMSKLDQMIANDKKRQAERDAKAKK